MSSRKPTRPSTWRSTAKPAPIKTTTITTIKRKYVRPTAVPQLPTRFANQPTSGLSRYVRMKQASTGPIRLLKYTSNPPITAIVARATRNLVGVFQRGDSGLSITTSL